MLSLDPGVGVPLNFKGRLLNWCEKFNASFFTLDFEDNGLACHSKSVTVKLALYRERYDSTVRELMCLLEIGYVFIIFIFNWVCVFFK